MVLDIVFKLPQTTLCIHSPSLVVSGWDILAAQSADDAMKGKEFACAQKPSWSMVITDMYSCTIFDGVDQGGGYNVSDIVT